MKELIRAYTNVLFYTVSYLVTGCTTIYLFMNGFNKWGALFCFFTLWCMAGVFVCWHSVKKSAKIIDEKLKQIEKYENN